MGNKPISSKTTEDPVEEETQWIPLKLKNNQFQYPTPSKRHHDKLKE
jgi:hypothetical protein